MIRATTQCSRCGPYRTVVFKTLNEDGSVFLECQGCKTTFPDVVADGMVIGPKTSQIASSTSYATEPEIDARGWHSLIEREAPRPLSAQELIERAGWTPGRRVEVEAMLAELAAAEHIVVQSARDLLAEYSGLEIESQHSRHTLRIDGHDAAERADPGWCDAYARGIGRALTPVGFFYSHMTLMIDEDGAFWGGFDDLYGYQGADMVEVVRNVLVERPPRQFDRVVEDCW